MAKKPANKNPAIKKHPHEYRFKLGAFSKDRFPMGILAEYLRDLAIVYGQEERLHFVRLDEGSAVAVARAETEAEPEIQHQLSLVKSQEASPEVMQAYARINTRLREHNTDGVILAPNNKKILEFPGCKVEVVEPTSYGPFNQPGTLEGTPIMIGGKDTFVPIHLEDWRGEQHICYAKRPLAKEIAAHLFSSNILVEGRGRWLRHADGEWELKRFTALDFKVVPLTTLEDDIERLRSVPAKWKELEDPLKDLDIIRHDNEVQ